MSTRHAGMDEEGGRRAPRRWRRLSLLTVVTLAGLAFLLSASAHASAGTLAPRTQLGAPSAGFGEGSGFCSSAVPGGYKLGASFDDVYTCGPASGYYVPASGTYKGFFEDAPYGYQCTELANRFVFDIWGLNPVNANGDDYVSTLHGAHPSVPLIANGTAGQPYLPGDIVSFTGTGSLANGHVAVVMASTYAPGDSGNYTVTLLEENASSSGENTAAVTNWKMAESKGCLGHPV